MQQDETGTLAALKERRKGVLKPLVAEHQGRIVKVMGDGVLVEFASAVNAVQCAVELQKRMAAENDGLPDERCIALRVGINLGDVIVEGGDLYGDGVNIAARLQERAEPGGILVSGTAYDHVRNKVGAGFDDLHTQALKNITEPVRIYRVVGTPPVAAPTPKSASDKPSIAVLPFTNMSDDREQEYFSDGITEDIITELSRFHSLFVIARISSIAFKSRSMKVQDITRELGVAYVVEGSVRRDAGRVRINAQLIEAGTGNHLWAERYDRDMRDIFALQDEVAHAIASTVSGRVEAAGRDRAVRLSPTTLRAYDLVLRAKALPPQYTKADNAQVLVCAERAVELDPTSARAHAHAAWCHYFNYMACWAVDRENSLAKAYELAQHAVVLDETDSFA